MRPSVMYFFLVCLWTSTTAAHGFSARSLTSITHQRLVQQDAWGGLSDALQSAGEAISSAAENVVGSVTDTAAKAMLGDRAVDSFELPPPTIRQINKEVVLCVVALLAVLGAGYAADLYLPARKVLTRPSYSCMAMLLGSYAILIPGLVSNLFEFLLGVQMLGINVLLTEVDGEPSPIAESTFGLVHLLCQTGGYVGAVLVVLYAMVIPSVKLIALVSAEIWRDSEDPRKVQRSKRFIQVVQFISKWACPDMFAYILLLYLFRHLDGQGGIVVAPARLGIGFACFSIFCVFSTFSTLMIRVPDTADDLSDDVARPMLARWFGIENIQMVTAALALMFLVLFGLGLAMPVMVLYLDSNLLIKPRGPLDPSMKPIVDTLHIEDLVNSEVTIFSATAALAKYIASGELNDIFAVVMLTVFVMALPIVNMFCLLAASWHLRSKQPDTAAAWQFLRHSTWLKHISMLDVFIMGIIVVTAAGSAYSQQGVLFGVMVGLWILLLAEVTHYFTHYQVHGVYRFLENNAEKQ
ncbi:unnamed protein product [Symbiodinium natans]|uniref:Paraquat-inducible protein A n=1 Tax=Symbiodinium natans TaxID=878477 RepID=A0A812T446_9DINO|nr:unnamed protein product [Symbiodinium natans]